MKSLLTGVLLIGALLLTGCKERSQEQEPTYIIQVSLGGWHSPDYSASQIIARVDSVAQMIPVEKVIIGWSLDREIYREVGAYLKGQGMEMLLWLPVFAETEEVCENTAADKSSRVSRRVPSRSKRMSFFIINSQRYKKSLSLHP